MATSPETLNLWLCKLMRLKNKVDGVLFYAMRYTPTSAHPHILLCQHCSRVTDSCKGVESSAMNMIVAS